MVNVSLEATAGTPLAFPARRFRRAVMAGADRDDGLDHVFAKSEVDTLEVVLFMLGETAEVAEVNAISLCERAFAHAPDTSLSIRSCRTRSIGQW